MCVCACVRERFQIPTKVERDKITVQFKGKKSHFQTILNWESNPICILNYTPK